MADAYLWEDARSEICRECGERGDETGLYGVSKIATESQSATVSFKGYACKNRHEWYQGEGKERGIGGDDPILFEEHFASRRKREIFTSIGTPDTSIVQGMYNRTHPQGRKVNSKDQREKNGASYYR